MAMGSGALHAEYDDNRVGEKGGAERDEEWEDGEEVEVDGDEEEPADGGQGEEEEGYGSEVEEEEEEDEEEERVVKRKIIIVVSFGGKGEENERRRSPSPRFEAEVDCQVDGCNVDLGEAKRYHRRHKVCEAHAKAAAARVGGVEQRFCQQCSRFHELALFDGAKRSCRNRLAGHNERRRKVPPAMNADVSKQQVAVPRATIRQRSPRVPRYITHVS